MKQFRKLTTVLAVAAVAAPIAPGAASARATVDGRASWSSGSFAAPVKTYAEVDSTAWWKPGAIAAPLASATAQEQAAQAYRRGNGTVDWTAIQARQNSRPAQAVSENSPLYSSPRVSPQPVATGGRGIDWRDTGIGAGLAALIASIVGVSAGAAIGRGRGRAAHA